MNLDWQELGRIAGDEGKELLDVIKPFLPALAREGPDVYEGFIKHLGDGEFDQIDQLMFEKMTPSERRELINDVYKGARDAAMAKYRRKELTKDIMVKLAIRIALRVATAGIV